MTIIRRRITETEEFFDEQGEGKGAGGKLNGLCGDEPTGAEGANNLGGGPDAGFGVVEVVPRCVPTDGPELNGDED